MQLIDLGSLGLPPEFEPGDHEKCSPRSRMLFLLLSSLGLWLAIVWTGLWLQTLPQ